MPTFNILLSRGNYSFLIYCFSTLFMVFASVPAIHYWPDFWAQFSISLVCIVTILLVLSKEMPNFNHIKKWPQENKHIPIVIVLGILNIYFSENRWNSLKGMGLFLMSGIMIFSVTYFLFRSKKNQDHFFCLCAFSFFILIAFGFYEYSQQLNNAGKRILLFSANPIPAGSLLILLSTGPLALLSQSKTRWGKSVFISSLVFGSILIVFIGQRGPVLAMLVMAFLWVILKRKKLGIFVLTILVLTGIGYLVGDNIPMHYKNRILKKDTILVRLEFYNISWNVVKDQPLLGLGFNSPLSKYIPADYESKVYPAKDPVPFTSHVIGLKIFDNMLLVFLAEMGILFTIVYLSLLVRLLRKIAWKKEGKSENEKLATIFLIVIAGFFIHSMTYDSLKYPHLNWLFHSLLGLIANSNNQPSREVSG